MWGKKDKTCAAIRLIEGIRLIWGPLNTGLTVDRLSDFPGFKLYNFAVS